LVGEVEGALKMSANLIEEGYINFFRTLMHLTNTENYERLLW